MGLLTFPVRLTPTQPCCMSFPEPVTDHERERGGVLDLLTKDAAGHREPPDESEAHSKHEVVPPKSSLFGETSEAVDRVRPGPSFTQRREALFPVNSNV